MAEPNSTELNIIARLVDEASGPIGKLRSELERIGGSTTGNLSTLQRASSGVRIEMEKVAPAVERGLGSIAPQAVKATTAVSGVKSATAGLGASLEGAASPLVARFSEANAALGSLARGLSLFGARGAASLSATGSEISGLASGLGAASAAALPLAAALAAVAASVGGVLIAGKALSDATEDASRFEEQFSRLPNVITLTRNESEALRATIFDLSRSFGANETQVAALFYLALQEGARNAAQATDLVTAALRLQAAGVVEASAAIRAIGDVLDAFGESAGTFAEVGSKIREIALSTGTSFEQVARAFSLIGVAAEESGASLEQVGALFIALRERGKNATRAANEIRTALELLTSQDIRDKLAAYGVTFRQVELDGGRAIEVFRRIGQAIGTSSEALGRVDPQLARINTVIAQATDHTGELAARMQQLQVAKDTGVDRLQASFATLSRTADGLRKVVVESFGRPINDSIARIVQTIARSKPLLDGLATGLTIAKIGLESLLRALEGVALLAGNVAESISNVFEVFGKIPTTVTGAVGAVAQTVSGTTAALRKEVEETRENLQGILGGVKDTGEISRISDQVKELKASARAQIILDVQSKPIEAARDRANELGEAIRQAELAAGQAPDPSFVFRNLSEAIAIAQEKLSELPPEIAAVLADVEGLDFGSDNKLVLKKKAELSFDKKQANDAIQSTLDGLGAIKVPITFDSEAARQDIGAAIDTLLSFQQSAAFRTGFIKPEVKAQVDAAVASIQKYTEEGKRLSDTLRDISDGSQVFATASEQARAKLEREVEGYRDIIAEFQRLGLSTAQIEEGLGRLIETRTEQIDRQQREERKKAADDLFRSLDENQRRAREFREAIRRSEREVQDALDSIDTGVVDTFEREKKALDEALERTFQRIVAAFENAPVFDIDGLNDALEEFKAKAEEARATLQQTQVSSFLESTQRQILDVRDANLDLADGTEQSLGRITNALARERLELEALTREGRIASSTAEQLGGAAEKLADKRTAQVLVDVSLRSRFQVDEELFRADLERKLVPLVNEARDVASRLLDAPVGSEERFGLAKQLAEIEERARGVRLELEHTDRRFGQGFAAALRQSLEEMQDSYRNGAELARDFTNALTGNFAQLLSRIGLAKISLKDFTRSLIADLQAIAAQNVSRSVFAAFAGLFVPSAAAPNTVPLSISGAPVAATGGIVQGAIAQTHGISAQVAQAASSGGRTLHHTARLFERGGVMPGQMVGRATGISNAVTSFQGFLPGRVMPVREYATGGVATSPQVAVFAERPGMAEAFVPLPGPGRGIPVEFKGQRGNSSLSGASVTINLHASAIDSRGMREVLQEQSRVIGDIVTSQLASGANNGLRTAVGSSRR